MRTWYKSTCGDACLRRSPASRNLNPLGKAAALLALDIHNVRITPASAADAVLLDRIRIRPVFVFFDPFLFVLRRHLQPRYPRKLAGRRIRRAVLDGRVPVSEVTEIMDIAR